ncbi:MAG: type II toxin-antitoxin system Phd/YefM family antitoxin [Acidimicrobiales bacterium]
MKVGVRELRNQTSRVIDAVRAGERVVLTVHGESVAGPHGSWTEHDPLIAPRRLCLSDRGRWITE